MPGDFTWQTIRSQVELLVNFVHAPLPAGRPGVCEVCHGAVRPQYPKCMSCASTSWASSGLLSDVVVPISYRLDGQHAHDLRMYKADTAGTAEARKRLASLFWDFCQRHISCVKAAAGVGSFSHVCFVPSTKNPDAEHPLQSLLAPAIPLHRIDLKVNRSVPADRREFHAEWFDAGEDGLGGDEITDVLLVDDTWVTGARMQSAAHCLKHAGARRVASLVLARQLNPEFVPAEPLIREAKRTRFNPETCVLHQRFT